MFEHPAVWIGLALVCVLVMMIEHQRQKTANEDKVLRAGVWTVAGMLTVVMVIGFINLENILPHKEPTHTPHYEVIYKSASTNSR